MFSAVKINGKRLYELAREGKTVERKSRTVTIHEIEMTDFDAEGDYTEISFRVLCSKGTYIRTLCVDIGKKLGVPSVMVKLVRTVSAGITEDQCLTLEQIEQFMKDDILHTRLIPWIKRLIICRSIRFLKKNRSPCKDSACPQERWSRRLTARSLFVCMI